MDALDCSPVADSWLLQVAVLSVLFVSVERHISLSVLNRPHLNLLFILLQEELEGLSANYPDRFKVYYVLNQVSSYNFISGFEYDL